MIRLKRSGYCCAADITLAKRGGDSGILRNERTTVVIWRENKGWTGEDYERDRDFVATHELTKGTNEVFVNGDSLIPGAWALDPVFRQYMFTSAEA